MRSVFLILAAALVVFGGTLWAPFHLDDFALMQNPIVTSPQGWWRSFSLMQTRPLSWFSFWMSYQLGGSDPMGYHMVNLILHLTSILVVWKVLRHPGLGLLTPSRAHPEAVVATALFALHPIQAEAVAYVFDRATLLMTVFCLLTLYAWIQERWWRAALWFIPALLAKEECVTFPLFLYLVWRIQHRNSRLSTPIRSVLLMLSMSLLTGLRVLYVSTVTTGSGAGAQAGISPFDYLLTQGVALLRYLRLLILPYGFTIESPLKIPSVETGVIAWVVVLTLIALAWRYIDRLWPIAWLILVVPASSILPAADLSADRRMYLPMIAVGVIAAKLLAKRPPWVAVTILASLSLISVRQTLVWMSGERLWREAVQFAPQKIRPKVQLARQVPHSEALSILKEAERTAPEDPLVPSERGRVLLEQNNPQAALSAFGRALALAPADARAVNNRGVALLRLNQKEAAIADFSRALTMEPCLFDARRNLHAMGVRPLPPPVNCSYTPEQKDSLPR